MAEIIPNAPLPNSRAEAKKLFQYLKRLPDEYVVLQPFAVSDKADFLVITPDRKALFLIVSSLTRKRLAELETGLISTELREEAVLRHMKTETQCNAGVVIPSILIFPNLRQRDIPGHLTEKATCFDKQTLRLLDQLLATQVSATLSVAEVSRLRAAFTPEVIVPQSFTTRRPDRNIDARLTPFLLDYQQEQALKTDLEMSPEGERSARDFGIRLINGVAGSGKSLILIYRAKLLRELYPHKRIVMLTHNRALVNDLRERYVTLSGDTKTHWLTFQQWCWRIAPPELRDRFRNKINAHDRMAIVKEMRDQHLEGTAVSADMLIEEIDWFKDQIPTNLNGYLMMDRTGRVFPLNESMRRRVYAAMYDYQRELWRRNKLDWGDVPRELWLAERKGGVTLPQYDVVLVDEAQFFAPLWFDFVRRIIKPDVGQLFMVADPTQGFMKRRHSWQSNGLNVRGRTVRLAKSYRTTREIMDFATLLYRTRLPDQDDSIVEPDTHGMPTGAVPQVIQLSAIQDEHTRIINEIRQLLKMGVPAKDMLVIHADSAYTSTHCDRFNADLPTITAYDPRYANEPNGLRIISLDAATGIESPIVFLIGVHQLYEREQSLRLSHSEREELIAENTRRLYMAITRAGRRLVLTYVGELPLFFRESTSK